MSTSQRQVRELWNGTPVRGGDLFTVHKLRGCRQHAATCELWSHQFGWELKLLVNGEWQRTQVCSSIQEWRETADAWKAALLEKGWA